MPLVFGDFELDQERRQLLRGGEPVPLEPKAYELLCLLVERRPRALSRAQIRDVVWPDTIVTESTLGVVVNGIRQALGDDAKDPRFIRTVRGFGYAFCGEVQGDSTVEPPAATQPPGGDQARGLPEILRGRAHTLGWGATAALLLLLVLLVGWWFQSRRTSEAPPRPVEIRPFTTDGRPKDQPRLSPDGERVAYTATDGPAGNWDIYVKALGHGSRPLRLTTHPGADAEPVWSPDGRHIAFVRLIEDDATLHSVPSHGGQEAKLIDIGSPALTDYGFLIPAISWSPDGDWLALARAEEAVGRPRIVRLELPTLEMSPLTSPLEKSEGDLEPAIGPDGSVVAFVRSGTAGLGKLDIWIQPVTGGEPAQLTSGQYDVCHSLTWTASGDALVFTGGKVGLRQRIYRVPLDGGDPEPVLGVGEKASSASIRGDRMVYVQMDGGALDIWRVPGWTAPTMKRTPEKVIVSSLTDRNPAYSPDGRRVAFESSRTGWRNVWICDEDGSNPIQVTEFESGAGTPRWSPDGRTIIFDALEAGSYDIYLVDVDGGRPRRLTDGPSADVRGTFSRDGRWIYFASDRSGRFEIWKMPAKGGVPSQITHSGGVYAVESWDGQILYYSQLEEDCAVSQVPVAGGDGTELIPGPVSWTDWALSRSGIYFAMVDRQADARDYRIHFLGFGSDQAQEIYRKTGPLVHNWLAVAPDDEWVLFGEAPRATSDIMLIENFR